MYLYSLSLFGTLYQPIIVVFFQKSDQKIISSFLLVHKWSIMLLKWLVIGSVIYVLYRYFFGANTLKKGPENKQTHIDDSEDRRQYTRENGNEDDYIDYEEVE